MGLSMFDIKRILRPKKDRDVADDFRMIDSWALFKDNKDVNKRDLEYLCYELETIDPNTGEKFHFYKALKFLRVIRLPKSSKQSTAFMEMHQQVLTSVFESGINLITVIANIIDPVPLGLLYLYGVQGTGSSIEEAQKKAHKAYVGFRAAMQGTYRVLEMRCINSQETEWLREKMYNMDYLTIVRGIPKANEGGEDMGNKGLGGTNSNPDSQGTLEEIIAGMVDYEYVIQVLSTPVSRNTLVEWSRSTEKNMTDWNSQLQGTKTLSFNLSVPMMFMSNQSASQGWNKAYTDANSVNYSHGQSFNTSFGENVGQALSQTFGRSYGQTMGKTVTDSITQSHGISQGTSYGQTLGHSMGTSQNISVSQGFNTSHSTGSSFGQSVGQSLGTSQNMNASQGLSTNHSAGNSVGQSVGQSAGVSQNVNASQGVSSNHSTGQSYGTSFGQSSGVSQSANVTQGQSINHSNSMNVSNGHSVSNCTSYNVSQGQNVSQSHSVGNNQSISTSMSENISRGNSATFGQTAGSSMGQSYNDSYGSNWSHGTSASQSHSASQGGSYGSSVSYGTNQGTSVSAGEGSGNSAGAGAFGFNMSGNDSTNAGVSGSYGSNSGMGFSRGASWSEGNNIGWGSSDSAGGSVSHGVGVSNSSSFSQSASNSESLTHSTGMSTGNSYGASESYGVSSGQSLSQGWGANQSNSQSMSIGQGVSEGYGSSISMSNGYGTNQGVSTSQNAGISSSDGYGQSMSMSTGYGTNQGVSSSQNLGQSWSDGYGQSVSMSNGYGTSQGVSASQNAGISSSDSFGQSYSVSNGYGVNESYSQSQSFTQSQSENFGISQGRSVGNSYSESVTESASQGNTQSYGQSQSVGRGESVSSGTGSSQSLSTGASGAYAMGTSSSMGLGPSIGYNKSYQWLDQQVKDILELLEFQNERIKKALRGEGAFYTYVAIACPSQDALSAAMAAAKSTWQNEFAMTHPIQVLNLSEEEQKHLLYHFAAFSIDVSRENVYGVEDYKYETVLLPSEFVAYTHLPRISEGGVFADVNDVPKFAVPSMMKGEIYMGTILSAERYSFNNGYKTPFDFRIDESELMHGFFTGASRSGKTVAAMRFVAELSQVRRKKTGKRMRIVCMDPKQDWRTLARFVEPERFQFFSLGRTDFRPVKINPLKIPRGVEPQFWIDGLIDIYCRAYGLLERGKQMMGETIYQLYEEAGVFEARKKPDWKDECPRLSKEVTFNKVYKRMESIKAKLEDPTNPKGKAGNDTRDAYARLLDRLQAFNREFSIEYKLFGTSEGIGIDDLIGEDDVTVLESKGLEKTFRNFIFGIITSGFYKYAIAHEGGYLAENQYETLLVIEEANEVLVGNDAAGSGGGSATGLTVSGQSEFEEILDQSAGYGLFIMAITQRISLMPASIIANAGLVFAGKLKIPDDITTVVRAVAREERFDDRDLVKWFPRSPIGWFVCQSSRNFDFKDSEPLLVAISRLNVVPPSNAEIEELLSRKEYRKRFENL